MQTTDSLVAKGAARGMQTPEESVTAQLKVIDGDVHIRWRVLFVCIEGRSRISKSCVYSRYMVYDESKKKVTV